MNFLFSGIDYLYTEFAEILRPLLVWLEIELWMLLGLMATAFFFYAIQYYPMLTKPADSSTIRSKFAWHTRRYAYLLSITLVLTALTAILSCWALYASEEPSMFASAWIVLLIFLGFFTFASAETARSIDSTNYEEGRFLNPNVCNPRWNRKVTRLRVHSLLVMIFCLLIAQQQGQIRHGELKTAKETTRARIKEFSAEATTFRFGALYLDSYARVTEGDTRYFLRFKDSEPPANWPKDKTWPPVVYLSAKNSHLLRSEVMKENSLIQVVCNHSSSQEFEAQSVSAMQIRRQTAFNPEVIEYVSNFLPMEETAAPSSATAEFEVSERSFSLSSDIGFLTTEVQDGEEVLVCYPKAERPNSWPDKIPWPPRLVCELKPEIAVELAHCNKASAIQVRGLLQNDALQVKESAITW